MKKIFVYDVEYKTIINLCRKYDTTEAEVVELLWNYATENGINFSEYLYERIDKNDQMEILMLDRNSKKEAEKRIEKQTANIYEYPSEWIEQMEEIGNFYSLEEVKDGKVADVSIVNYNNHEYLIEYIN